MEISLKKSHGYFITFKADNVDVIEDIEERTYEKLENGKYDFLKTPKRDISTDSLNQIVSLLDDMIYYRESKFDSSSLIESLFDKLSEENKAKLVLKLQSLTQ